MGELIEIFGKNVSCKLKKEDFLNEDTLREKIQDSYVLEDLITLLPVYGVPECEFFSWDDFDAIDEVIDKELSIRTIPVPSDFFEEEQNTESDSEFIELDVAQFVKDVFHWWNSDENSEIQAGRLWSSQLEAFIDKGEWIVGLDRGRGEPLTNIQDWPAPQFEEIDGVKYPYWEDDSSTLLQPTLWYGIKGTPASYLWSLEDNIFPALVRVEDGMGSYGSQVRIDGFELNYQKIFDPGVCNWYFGCGGNSGADFSKVMKTCPIDLDMVLRLKNQEEELINLVLKLQGHDPIS